MNETELRKKRFPLVIEDEAESSLPELNNHHYTPTLMGKVAFFPHIDFALAGIRIS